MKRSWLFSRADGSEDERSVIACFKVDLLEAKSKILLQFDDVDGAWNSLNSPVAIVRRGDLQSQFIQYCFLGNVQRDVFSEFQNLHISMLFLAFIWCFVISPYCLKPWTFGGNFLPPVFVLKCPSKPLGPKFQVSISETEVTSEIMAHFRRNMVFRKIDIYLSEKTPAWRGLTSDSSATL